MGMQDKSLRNERDVEFALRLPVLAIVPAIEPFSGKNPKKRSLTRGSASDYRPKRGGLRRNMYQRFFSLRESPFNVNPDPRYLFMTRQIQEALAGLTYGIQNRKGFILLTGEVGTGKTTLLNRLLDWLRGQRVATAYIFNSRLRGEPSVRFHYGGF